MVSRKVSKKSSNNLFAWLSAILLSSLLIVSIIMLWKHARHVTESVVVEEIQTLKKVFSQIHKDCYIKNFEHTRNYIDFLNVISFVGSRVGAMNLAYPKNWKGPYLKNNPTIQEKFYVLLKTKQGYFIVPGNGVRLSNGQIIGKDIKLNEKSNMYQLMQDPQGLWSKSGALAAEIKIGTDFMNTMMQSPEVIYSID